MMPALSMVADARQQVRLIPEADASAMPQSDERLRYMVEAHFDFIWRSLRGLGVPSGSVDDAAQHVFLIASQKLDAIELGREKSFLFSTARGVAANARRSIARSRERLDDVAIAASVDPAPDPEQALSSQQGRKLLETILETMDEDTREVFVLFELEGLTTSSIATLIGAPMGTVASRLRRAREAFQREARRIQASGGGK
jgi:RNA polymerase sigma-70 factor (ECF subfamily)